MKTPIGKTASGRPLEYIILGITYLVVMCMYLSLASRKVDNPNLRRGYLLFATGYIFFGISFLVGDSDIYAGNLKGAPVNTSVNTIVAPAPPK